MSNRTRTERALLLLEVLDTLFRDSQQPVRKLEVKIPPLMARVLAAGGHTCREAVLIAARDYVDAWQTERLAEKLTGYWSSNDGEAPPEQLISNLRVRTRQLRRRRLQLLHDLRVEVREYPPGTPFDPAYHTPQLETIPAPHPDDEGKVAQMLQPAFVWREEGLEQVESAQVLLFGPPPPEAELAVYPPVPKTPVPTAATKRQRRSRSKRRA